MPAATIRVRGPLVLLLLLDRRESIRRRDHEGFGYAHCEQSQSKQRSNVLTRHPVDCVVVLTAG